MNKSTAVDDNPCLKLDISRHGMLNNTNLKLYPGTSDWSFRSTGENENEEKLEILFITGIQIPVQCAFEGIVHHKTKKRRGEQKERE